jgi:hypothetical protein
MIDERVFDLAWRFMKVELRIRIELMNGFEIASKYVQKKFCFLVWFDFFGFWIYGNFIR